MASSLERLQAARQGAPVASSLDRLIAARGGQRVEHGNVQPGQVLSLDGGPQPAGVDVQGILRDTRSRLDQPWLPSALVDLTDATARTVGHNLLPSVVGQETPEQGATFDQAMIEALSMAGGAGAGGLVSKGVHAVGKGFLRGGTKSGIDRWLIDNARHMVPSGSPATTRLAWQLARPTAVGVGTEMAIDWNDPATSEFWDSLISIPLGIAAGGAAASQSRSNLLLQHPKFREVAMRASRAGLPSRVIGALVAHYLAQLVSNPEEAG